MEDRAFAAVAGDAPARRARVAAIMSELAGTHPSGFGFGTMSFRSHAEAFLASTRDPAAVRAGLEAILVQERGQLQPLIAAGAASAGAEDLLPWRRAFAYGWGVLDGAVDAGALSAEVLDGVRGAAAGPPPSAGARGPSEFHRAIGRAGIEDDPQPWFAVYRMLLNCFYGVLGLLAISPRERYYLCLVVAEVGDDALGESWTERLDHAQALRAAAQRS